jgi:hypothetical protein
MTAALALLLVLQGDPQIEKVERLVGNVNRPLLWMPLKVTLSSATDFSGDVLATSRFGFSVARRVVLKAGGREEILLPSIGAEEVVAGKTRFKLPGDFVRPDRIVLVDARLPYAGDLVSTEKILFQKIAAADLEKTLPRGLLEAADLVLVKEGLGTPAPTRADAEKAVASLTETPATLEVVDRFLWTDAPQTGWVPAKKTWTLFFATTYAFAAFVALAVLAKRFPKFGLACVGAVALLGLAGYRLFPRGQLWIVGQAVDVVPAAGAAVEHRVWFLQSVTDIPAAKIDFPRLVKPVFPAMGGADEPFVLRVDDRGSSVEDLRIPAGRPACFGGSELRAAGKEPEGQTGIVTVRDGAVEQSGPLGAEFNAWKRFVGRDGRFALAGRAGRAAGSIQAAELADEHDRPPIFIKRLK